MLQTLKLLLPAIIPSWRFFDTIAPSPRIEFTLLEVPDGIPGLWQEFRPRPAILSSNAMLKRLFWNPSWNESLFLVSCAERLMTSPGNHSMREIINRIKRDLAHPSATTPVMPYLQFRLAFLSRSGDSVRKHITFISPVCPFSESVDA